MRPIASSGVVVALNRAEARHTWLLTLILLIGLVLRVAYALEQPTVVQYTSATGGDSSGYLANGAGFFSGQEHGWIREIPFYISNLKPAPLYILFVGIFQVYLPDHEAIIAIRLVQSLLSIATAYLACQMATIISRDKSAGLIAGALTALHPALVAEPAQIATETLYIYFLALGLWLYLEYVSGLGPGPRLRWLGPAQALALSAAAFGLATLTRGVAVLLPLVISLHLLQLGRHRLQANWRRHCLLLLLVYSAVVSTWTIYNLLNWNRFVIVSDQLMGALWRGAERDDGSPEQNDRLLLEGMEVTTPADCVVDCKFEHATETYVNKIGAIIAGDPGGYLALRLSELAYAILQPYGTTPFGDTSIIEASRQWISDDRSLRGLMDVIQIQGFAVKLATWILHYTGIVFGLLGMYWARKQWVTAVPLAAVAAYTITVHFFLLALPRYLFPIEIVWLVFAASAMATLYQQRERSRTNHQIHR